MQESTTELRRNQVSELQDISLTSQNHTVNNVVYPVFAPPGPHESRIKSIIPDKTVDDFDMVEKTYLIDSDNCVLFTTFGIELPDPT